MVNVKMEQLLEERLKEIAFPLQMVGGILADISLLLAVIFWSPRPLWGLLLAAFFGLLGAGMEGGAITDVVSLIREFFPTQPSIGLAILCCIIDLTGLVLALGCFVNIFLFSGRWLPFSGTVIGLTFSMIGRLILSSCVSRWEDQCDGS